MARIVASVESAITNLAAEEKPMITNHVAQTITAFIHTNKPKPTLSGPELKAMKSLRNRTDLIFAPADKGRAVAVIEKVISLLEDGKTYQK